MRIRGQIRILFAIALALPVMAQAGPLACGAGRIPAGDDCIGEAQLASRIDAIVGTIVETRLILTEGSPIALNYLLRQTPAGWRIVDIYLAGTISELARRRDEFASIIRNQGVDGLIALLKRKNQELAGSS